MNENASPEPEKTPENNAEVVKPSGNRVEVSADLLNEAVTQLRKMTEIRQRDSERQERAISQMQSTIKRQGILSRYVIFTSALVVLISIGLAYLMRQSSKNEQVTISTLEQVDSRLSETAETIAQESQRQVSSLDSVRNEVLTAREDQTRLSSDIKQQLQASQQAQDSVVAKVEEQLGAVREERDGVRTEVRNMLEEKTAMFTEKEIALRAERDAIKEAKKRSKEEQKALIQQTIERLNAMTASLTADDAAETPTDGEVDAAVETADAVEAVIADDTEAPAEPGIIETVVETAGNVVDSIGGLITGSSDEAEVTPEAPVEETVIVEAPAEAEVEVPAVTPEKE